jgi:hypothetical protein
MEVVQENDDDTRSFVGFAPVQLLIPRNECFFFLIIISGLEFEMNGAHAPAEWP